MKAKIKLGATTLQESARRFVEAWQNAERNDRVDPSHALTFEDMETFLRVVMRLRYIAPSVEADLRDRMVFVVGARQVGKTTLALSLLGMDRDESSPACLTWDDLEDRSDIIAGRLPPGQPRVIFDEIHKYGPDEPRSTRTSTRRAPSWDLVSVQIFP